MSEEFGLCAAGAARRVAGHLAAAGLPVRIGDIRARTGGALPTAGELVERMAQDKKAKAGRLSFVLVSEIGEAFSTDAVEADRLFAFLEARCRP
jgi:3-dehydroquinate synthetase